MLLRLGRVAYLCIFALVVVLWTGSYGKSREVVHKGWDMTTQAFGQGSSFAVDDMVALDLGSDAGVAHGIDEEHLSRHLLHMHTSFMRHKTPMRVLFWLTSDS